MKPMFCLTLFLIACGPPPEEPRTVVVTIPKVRQGFVREPVAEEVCPAPVPNTVRMCFMGTPILGDLRVYAQEDLRVNRYERIFRGLIAHLSDRCYDYLCVTDIACAAQSLNLQEVQACIDYSACCAAVVEQ